MPVRLEPLDVSLQIPYHFRCPISLELMRDPVTLSTGQTYDRTSIESWFATGNSTCPVTRISLTDFNFIPNHTLRRLIQTWCVANRSAGVERIPTPKQPADAAVVRTLLNRASSKTNTTHSRVAALSRLGQLARDSEKNRSLISSQNVRGVLIPVAFPSSASELSTELNHEALAVLSMFPLHESDCDLIASDPERVRYLVNLLSHSLVEVRVNSASIIESVVSGTKSVDLRDEIASSDGIYKGIIEILNYPLPFPRALRIGMKALFALCLQKQNRHKAVVAGAVEALIDRLPDFEKCDAERALATAELLCRIPSGCVAFADHALTVPLLVKMILKVSDRATEYAAGALLAVCSASELCRREAAAAGALTRLLLLVQSDCTERAKRKAQMLLKLLRDSWPEEDSISNCNGFGCCEVTPF